MLGAALLDKAVEREAFEKHARLGRGEIPAVVRTTPAPDGLEQPTYCPGVIMRGGCSAQPRRAPSADNLLPRHPVDEEDDVASFLVDQRLEDLEHRFRQEAGPARDLEHTETEKCIEALAISEIGERAEQVAARWIWQALLGGDAVAPNHQPQELGMTGFFEPLKHDRLAHQRIGDRRGIGGNDRTRSALGVEDLLPERDRAQTPKRGFVEIGPRQGRRIESAMGRDKLAAEPLLVLVGADFHDAAARESDRGKKQRTNRRRHGTTVGRNSRGSYPERRRSFSARHTSISALIERSAAPTDVLPVRVKLLSCGTIPPSPSPAPSNPRAMPIRSQTRKAQTARILAQKIGRRHNGRLCRCHATQLTKKRMWRPSSCITGSNVSTKAGGKNPELFASANRPKAKTLSMHSLNPVTMKAHSGSRGR